MPTLRYPSLGTTMRAASLLILFALCFRTARAQDTTVVQTLTFKDITKRNGSWMFPPAGTRWGKILMYYTLKCDAATTQDQFPCGEWDYLSYATVYDSTGVIDSVLKRHASFIVNGATPDTFAYRNSPTSSYYRSNRKRLVIDATQSETTAKVGNGVEPITAPFSATGGGKARYLWTAAELTRAGLGLSAGPITGIFLDVLTPGASLKDFTVRIAQTALTALTPATAKDSGFTTVYEDNTEFTSAGPHRLTFTTPFTWDGATNLIVEFACDGAPASNQPALAGSATGSGIHSTATGGSLDFGPNDYVEIPDAVDMFKSVKDEVTISLWAYGNVAMPQNTSAFEAHDARGNRVLNAHLPWSNGSVYWDAGNNGESAYDRINKQANADQYKGRWNHWAFTKNAATGSMKMYLNGILWYQGTSKTRTMEGIARFRIGSGAAESGPSYRGRIDEVQVWDKELDAATIAAWMHKPIDPSHPAYSRLIGYYRFNEPTGETVADAAPGGRSGVMMGLPRRHPQTGSDIVGEFQQAPARPNLTFVNGVYTSHIDLALVVDTVQNSRRTVVLYEDPQNPTRATDTVHVWAAGYTYTYDEAGANVDSTWNAADGNRIATYYNYYEKYEVVDVVELGRYITPYGIGLDLGPEGFTWVYDVTDYAPYLHDLVTLSAGNQQELIDLKFVMMKGIPTRDVIKVDHVWPSIVSYSYKSLAEDTNMKERTIQLDPDARGFKLKTRITGHGHEGTVNQAIGLIHCCEWADKQHHLSIDGEKKFSWSIWQNDKCALNPVVAQGGNWAPPRAGWCPGAPVDDVELELTDMVTPGAAVRLDYGIDPVPANNTGQGSGNYVMTMDLIQYGPPNFTLDAAVEQIFAPNDWEMYRRFNPICGGPTIAVKNTGATELTSVKIRYGIVNGPTRDHTWTGSLKFLETATIDLPFDPSYWLIDTRNTTFFAEVSEPNGGEDEYDGNNGMTTTFVPPPTYPGTLVLRFRNNALPGDARFALTNFEGTVVHQRSNMGANEVFNDTLQLPPGCYTLTIITNEGLGLTYPLISQVGTGNATLRKIENDRLVTLKSFPGDFGKSIVHNFTVGLPSGVVNEPRVPLWADVYPNPSTGRFTVEALGDFGAQPVTIEVHDAVGRLVARSEVQGSDGTLKHDLDLTGLDTGIYLVSIAGGDLFLTKKLLKQ